MTLKNDWTSKSILKTTLWKQLFQSQTLKKERWRYHHQRNQPKPTHDAMGLKTQSNHVTSFYFWLLLTNKQKKWYLALKKRLSFDSQNETLPLFSSKEHNLISGKTKQKQQLHVEKMMSLTTFLVATLLLVGSTTALLSSPASLETPIYDEAPTLFFEDAATCSDFFEEWEFKNGDACSAVDRYVIVSVFAFLLPSQHFWV